MFGAPSILRKADAKLNKVFFGLKFGVSFVPQNLSNTRGEDAMPNRKLTLVTAIGLSLASPVLADDHDCFVPMSEWQPRAAVQAAAEAQGWQVLRIKADDGCYQIKGTDAEGRPIEVRLDPATLDILEIEFEPLMGDHDDGPDHDD